MNGKKIYVLGAENTGGVRTYVLNILNHLNEYQFYLSSNNLSSNELSSNIILIKSFKFHKNISIFKERNVLFFSHTLRTTFYLSIISLFYKIDFIFVAHGVRSTQLKKSVKYYLIKIAENFVYNRSILNIAISSEEFNYLQKRYENCVLIETGIKIQLKNVDKPIINRKEVIIYNIGKLYDLKDPFTFIEIAKHFNENTKIKFVWYGDGKLMNEVNNKIKCENINNVFFLGEKSNVELMNEISHHYAMLMTSKQEGVPISILESLLLNKPIIVNNFQGNAEALITHGVNGFIYNNVSEAVVYINKLLEENVYKAITENIVRLNMKLEEKYVKFIDSYNKIFNDYFEKKPDK